MSLNTVCVIGAGAWGTALAQAAAMAGRSVQLVMRTPERAAALNASHINEGALPGLALSDRITGVTEAGAADFYILAVPAQATRTVLSTLNPDLLAQKPVILSAKGLEAGTLARQSEILADMAPLAIPYVLSGPSFAADVAAGRPTAVTLAGDDADATSDLAAALAGPSFRPYAADDRIGVEIAGALKNVYALACGAVEGASLGASARSALIARGYAEMARMVAAMGGSAHTLTGLAGLGDLTLTCTSVQSRNYQFGMALGAGRRTEDILAGGAKLAEGVATAPVAAALAKSLGVDSPLIDAVDECVAGRADIATIVAGLMSRPLKREH
ncbi:MAG: NAD(P)-dependent glycerol-3-phosphate dehydrogenase [Devosia sp.]|uniref:NAD(P)H-dependent glycerol-3-phosphate dehydrogenase n=1 Tax=unclassified Devosia TaxID=196773 RepID=UPI0019FA0E21|nr:MULTISPECIES: NAD(P)H-dependent glycerol-3-phosphate dehydrogenase [unclassified Devosia]MBF0677399.1 NAD(P)-dependent glycerol-3-phosphate dehydrogenase [Devosia sp.]WEJ33459.1 NAD(P)-dependent glycerol-3-phosphate dehydrogenase [Devosia sp. SD17-2]